MKYNTVIFDLDGTLLDSFHEAYSQNMYRKTKPYEGVKETLRWLKKNHFITGVVSNKSDRETKELCRFFFGTDIDAALGDHPEREKKPAPDNLYAALRVLNTKKGATLYVGDSNVDVEAAKNAGLQFVAAAWGYRSRESLIAAGADSVIDRPVELIRLLESFPN